MASSIKNETRRGGENPKRWEEANRNGPKGDAYPIVVAASLPGARKKRGIVNEKVN